MRIGLGADHKGFPLKESVKAHLIELGYEVVDYGVVNEEPVDYPDVAELVAKEVAAGKVDRAVLCCGTGLGMAITANKVPGVRAATVTDPHSAERSVKSNNAQVICMGAEVVGPRGRRHAHRPLGRVGVPGRRLVAQGRQDQRARREVQGRSGS